MSWWYAAGLDSEQRKVYIWGRVALAASVLFLMSAYFTWGEIRYLLKSERYTATVTEASAVTAEGAPVTIKYQFTDSRGSIIRGKRTFDHGRGARPVGGTVDVRYIPAPAPGNASAPGSPGEVRLASDSQWWAPIVFFGTIALLIASVWKWWLSVKDDMKYA